MRVIRTMLLTTISFAACDEPVDIHRSPSLFTLSATALQTSSKGYTERCDLDVMFADLPVPVPDSWSTTVELVVHRAFADSGAPAVHFDTLITGVGLEIRRSGETRVAIDLSGPLSESLNGAEMDTDCCALARGDWSCRPALPFGEHFPETLQGAWALQVVRDADVLAVPGGIP